MTRITLAVSTLAITLAAFGVARAEDRAAADALPPAYIIHKLTADGVTLRALEPEDGIYEAKVLATDGSIVKVGVDPQTAELTDAYSHARPRAERGPSPQVDAAQAIQAVAATGHWDVRKVEYEKGRWEIDARDDQGRSARFDVDGVSAAVSGH